MNRVQVSAIIGNQLHQIEVEDVVCANVLFANGAFGSIQLTINQPIGYSIRQIAGDKGTIAIPDVRSLASDHEDHILFGTYRDSLTKMVKQPNDIAGQPDVSWQPVELRDELGGHDALMDSFIDAILHGGEALVNGESALPAVELINAIVLSAMRRKTVDVPVDREEYDELFEALSSGSLQTPRF